MTTNNKPKILILTGSTRPGRFNIQPAKWIYDLAKKRHDMEVELIDLSQLNLPFLDEPIPPSQRLYSKEHTKQWSKLVDRADGFIFVTPEYNHSYSAVLKNAIDFLWHEWNFKPVSFISYGSGAGGARAVEHLRAVAGETKMYDLRDQLLLSNYWDNLDKQGNFKFELGHERAANTILESLAFWSGALHRARTDLNDIQKTHKTLVS